MEIKIGNKILMKKVDDLPESIKAKGNDFLKEFEKNFAGRQFTVSEILKREPLIIEIEEDEIEEDVEKLIRLCLISEIMNLDRPISKKHHFSENFIEKVVEKVVESHEKNANERTHSFGWAIRNLKKGKRVARKGWNGKGIFLELQVPDEHSKMTHPYIYIDTTGLQTDNPAAPKDRVPWLASQTDMLSNDWYEVH